MLGHHQTIGRMTARRIGRRQEPVLPEISLLASLAAQLMHSGVRTEPTPDRTALLLYRPGASLPVWVLVGDGGVSFCWDAGRRCHPVADVIGAARALAAYLGGDTL
jgi:hypothetical protein